MKTHHSVAATHDHQPPPWISVVGCYHFLNFLNFLCDPSLTTPALQSITGNWWCWWVSLVTSSWSYGQSWWVSLVTSFLSSSLTIALKWWANLVILRQRKHCWPADDALLIITMAFKAAPCRLHKVVHEVTSAVSRGSNVSNQQELDKCHWFNWWGFIPLECLMFVGWWCYQIGHVVLIALFFSAWQLLRKYSSIICHMPSNSFGPVHGWLIGRWTRQWCYNIAYLVDLTCCWLTIGATYQWYEPGCRH